MDEHDFKEAMEKAADHEGDLNRRIAQLETALSDCIRAMQHPSLCICEVPNVAPDHPWAVLQRAKQAIGETS